MLKKFIFFCLLITSWSCKSKLDVVGINEENTNSPEFNFLIKADQKQVKVQSAYAFSLYVSQLDFSNRNVVYRFVPDVSGIEGYFVLDNNDVKVYQRKDWIEVKFSNFVNNEVKVLFYPTEKLINQTSLNVNLTVNCIDTGNKKNNSQSRIFEVIP